MPDTTLRDSGVETGGGNLATLLQPVPQDSLFDPPELPIEVLLRRLLHPIHKKEVALAYYPAKEKRTGKELSGIALEKHTDQAVKNVDRMLEGHRPIPVKLIDCVIKKVPGAGVAIAHYYADRAGCERGALKLEALRLGEEIAAIAASVKRADDIRDEAMRRLGDLQRWVSHATGGQR